MELLTIQLAANETKQFRKAGAYCEIIDSQAAIGINFLSVLGGQTGSIKGGLSGLYLEVDYGAFDITNGPAAQTVTLLLCDAGESGGSRRQPGNVRVIDEITDAIVSQPLTPSTAVAVINYTAIVTPAQNVRGLILRQWSLSVTSANPGFAAMQITACKSQPTNYSTPSQRYTVSGAGSSNAVNGSDSGRGNKYIPPGWGLWLGTEVATSPASLMTGRVEYEIQ